MLCDGQVMYICTAPSQYGLGCCRGSMTSMSMVELIAGSVESGTLTTGFQLVLGDGLTARENDPCECVEESPRTGPGFPGDQSAAFSNPNTSAAFAGDPLNANPV